MVQGVMRLISCKRAWMDPELEDLLSEVVEEHVTQVLHLLLNVRLPLEALTGRL